MERQAALADVPWVEVRTNGEVPDDLVALAEALRGRAIDGFVSGALRSDYQKSRLERMAEELGIVSWTPLWHQSGHEHLRGMIEHGFEIMITGVSAEGLTEAWLGRILTKESFEELAALASKHRFHVEGEGGEYETLVVGGPHMDQRLSVEAPSIGTEFEGITPFTEWLAVRARRTRRQFHLRHHVIHGIKHGLEFFSRKGGRDGRRTTANINQFLTLRKGREGSFSKNFVGFIARYAVVDQFNHDFLGHDESLLSVNVRQAPVFVDPHVGENISGFGHHVFGSAEAWEGVKRSLLELARSRSCQSNAFRRLG